MMKIVNWQPCLVMDARGCLIHSLDIIESPNPFPNLWFTFQNGPTFLKFSKRDGKEKGDFNFEKEKKEKRKWKCAKGFQSRHRTFDWVLGSRQRYRKISLTFLEVFGKWAHF